MIYITTFTSFIIYAFSCLSQTFGETIDQAPLAATCSAASTATIFSAVSYIDLVSAHDPEIVFGLKVPSDIAANIAYNEKLRFFKEKGIANAEQLASIVARAVLLTDKFTIGLYYFVTSNSFGEFLDQKGNLNCGNVIQTATRYFENEEREFKTLGSDVLESYVRAVLLGTNDLLEELGYTAEENSVNWKILIDIFYKEYSKYAATY